jgi:deoxyribose-phosphate aldolase
MKYSYDELARMIDHALLHPTLTEADLRAGCEMARGYGVASVCIKPYAVPLAVEMLRGSGVAVGTVIGFPHGSATTEVKRYETKVACRDGAREIDMVVNIGQVLSGEWQYVEGEIRAVCDEAHAAGALVKVILENDFLGSDDAKRELCEVSEKAGADFVKTSTGFAFLKGADGKFTTVGSTEHDLRLMRASVSARVQVKAAGGVRDLDGLIGVRELGATRCGTSATVQILDEYRRRKAAGESGAGPAVLGGGY